MGAIVDFFKDWADYLFNERRQDMLLFLSIVLMILMRSKIGEWINEMSDWMKGQLFNVALIIMSLIFFDTLGTGGIIGIELNYFAHLAIALFLMFLGLRQIISRGYTYADSQINTH